MAGPDQPLCQSSPLGTPTTPIKSVMASTTPPNTPIKSVMAHDNKRAPQEEANHALEDDTPSVTSTTPPDGGWGWVVVFASFMIHVIADGITYSFGIFMVKLMTEFGWNRSVASLIPSILVGVTLGAGPIASSLVNRYGCRLVTIVGALLASIGLATSTLAESITVFYFTIGICTGLGFGLIYLPAIVSVSMYFEKKRAFATGIAVCGSGLGTFIMAPVTKSLIIAFDWKGAMLVTAGLVLLNIIFGALFRPLGSPESNIKNQKSGFVPEDERALTICPGDLEQDNIAKIKRKNQESERSFKTPPIFESMLEFSDISARVVTVPTRCSEDNLLRGTAQELQVNGKVLPEIRPFAQQMGVQQMGVPDLQNGMNGVNGVNGGGKYSDMARMAMSHPAFLNQADRPHIHFGSHSQFQEMKKAQSLVPTKSGIMCRKDILYGGSLLNIPEYKTNPRQYSRSMRRLDEDDLLSVTSLDVDPRVCGCISVSGQQARAFNQMLDFTLFQDPIFMVYALSNFLTSIGFNVPYVYTVDRAILMGIDAKEASFLLSVVGIANTLGRILLGWISDRGWMPRLYLYIICISVCGLTMGLSVFCTSYTSQAIYCAIFGLTSGAYVGLTSVVLVDLLGLDKLTNAFGLLLLFQGIASVMGPPITGALYDSIGDYDAGFYFAGAMIFLSGVILVIIPFLQKRQKKLQKPTFSIHSNGLKNEMG